MISHNDKQLEKLKVMCDFWCYNTSFSQAKVHSWSVNVFIKTCGLLFNMAASVNQWCKLRGGANCLSDQWQMREWFKKLAWKPINSALPFSRKWYITFNSFIMFLLFQVLTPPPMFYSVRLSEMRFFIWPNKAFVLSLFVNLHSVRVAVAHEACDCDFTLREMKATFECKNASLSGIHWHFCT